MKYISAQEALNAEEITYQNLQLLFEASKTTAIELLVEKNKLAVSNSQLLQAKYDLVLRLKVLDYYEGKPLNLR
jgi:outer membrane protein